MQFEENSPYRGADGIAWDRVSPQQLWHELAGQVAQKWQLPQVSFLHVASASEVRLLGHSGESDLASIPAEVRQLVVSRELDEVEVVAFGAVNWLVARIETGDDLPLVLVAGGEATATRQDAVQIKTFAQALIATYEAHQKAKRSARSAEHLSQILDLGLMLGETTHFDPAALTLCNEVATQLKAMRVTLGWLAGAKLKLRATSHGGRVRNDTEAAGSLLRVMEEAYDQDLEVAHPALETEALSLQHKLYAEAHANCRVLSLPIRVSGKPAGVLTIEHAADELAVTQEAIDTLRVVLDLVGPRLEEMYRHSGWIGARIWRRLRRGVAKLIGYRHTGLKLTALILLLIIVLSLIIRIEHKVKSSFILKAEASAFLTAPFPGYIDKVYQDVGDTVQKGDRLLDLDRRDLMVQRAELLADRDRSLTETRRLEGEGELTEMLLSQLSVKQTDAKMRVLDYRLSRTQLRAPFDGIVVEGDLRERLSSPVQAGETLYRIVQLEGLYAELQVDERDINYLQESMGGEIAFASRPSERYQIEVIEFEPVAMIQETGTYFRVRVRLIDAPDDWWRPGMSGICKIDAGKASVAWVFMHRTIEYLRLVFWL